MKKVLTYPLRGVDAVVDRIVAVIGAVATSQLPAFTQHYLQRLGGHLEEARGNAAGWVKIASEAGKTTGQLVELYAASVQPEVVAAGDKCAADCARLAELEAAFTAISDTSVWMRPLSFLRHMDIAIARDTAAAYVPNVPLDLPSLCYAAAGMLLVWLLYAGTKSSVRAAWCRRQRRRAARDEVDTSDEV